MAAIGQTFYTPYSDYSFITSVELFFNSVDATLGCIVEITDTVSGQPGINILGRTIVNNAVADTTGATGTTVQFEDPILLYPNQLYFLKITPISNSPNYQLWTGVIGKQDNITGNTISNFAGKGNLFLGADNGTWSGIKNEALKFNVNFAKFNNVGVVSFTNKNYEFIEVENIIGNFISGEPTSIQTGFYNTAVVTVTSNSNTYSTGQTLTQGNTTAYIANTSNNVLYLTNVSGNLSNANASTSTANLVITVNTQNVIPYVSNNVTVGVTVPYAGQLNVGQTLALLTGNTSFVANVTTISNNNVVLDDVPNTLGSNITIATIQSGLNSVYQYNQDGVFVLSGSTATSNVNYSNIANMYLFGNMSGAYAQCIQITDLQYQTQNFQITDSLLPGTNISASDVIKYVGYTSSNADTIPVNSDMNLTNKSGIIASRTNEILHMNGAKSVSLNVSLISNSTTKTPFLFNSQQTTTIVNNEMLTPNNISGVLLYCNNYNLEFKQADVITQGNTVGEVISSNTTAVYCSNTSGIFTTGLITLASNANVTSTVTQILNINEETSTVIAGSRYITKQVNLSANQVGEDIVTYISAYRPAGTDLYCYAKLINPQDSTPYYDSTWTRLIETSNSVGVYSSTANTKDVIELTYELPSDNVATSCSTTSGNNVVTFTQAPNSLYPTGSYCWISGNNSFVTAQITASNNTTVTVSPAPNFTAANASINLINGLTSLNGAFKYGANNGVVRYVSNNGVFDTYSTFAIKIVPVSNNNALVPLADNMRAIALQV